MNTQPNYYNLRQIGEMIPAADITLRKRLRDRPQTLPPHEQVNGQWRFPADAFQDWMKERNALRKLTGKPYLRFIDEYETKSEAAFGDAVAIGSIQVLARQVEGEVARELWKKLRMDFLYQHQTDEEITALVKRAFELARKQRSAA